MRLTHSRDGKRVIDPLLCISLGVGALAAFPLGAAVNYFLTGTDGALATAILIGASAGAVILRGSVIAFDRLVRPGLFDREQRKHEIVPFRYTEQESNNVL